MSWEYQYLKPFPPSWAHTRLFLEQGSDVTSCAQGCSEGSLRSGSCTKYKPGQGQSSDGSTAPAVPILLLGVTHTLHARVPLLSAQNSERTPKFLHFVTPWGNLSPKNTCTQWVPKWGSHKEPAALYLKCPLQTTCRTFFREKQNHQDPTEFHISSSTIRSTNPEHHVEQKHTCFGPGAEHTAWLQSRTPGCQTHFLAIEQAQIFKNTIIMYSKICGHKTSLKPRPCLHNFCNVRKNFGWECIFSSKTSKYLQFSLWKEWYTTSVLTRV